MIPADYFCKLFLLQDTSAMAQRDYRRRCSEAGDREARACGRAASPGSTTVGGPALSSRSPAGKAATRARCATRVGSTSVTSGTCIGRSAVSAGSATEAGGAALAGLTRVARSPGQPSGATDVGGAT